MVIRLLFLFAFTTAAGVKGYLAIALLSSNKGTPSCFSWPSGRAYMSNVAIILVHAVKKRRGSMASKCRQRKVSS